MRPMIQSMRPSKSTSKGYIPPLSKTGSLFWPGQEGYLAPGVRGYAVKHEGRYYIPLVYAQNPGHGDMGRFLDSLHPLCCLVNIANPRLRGMLKRRGWLPEAGPVDVWSRPSPALRKP